jgi:hypothetical protein
LEVKQIGGLWYLSGAKPGIGDLSTRYRDVIATFGTDPSAILGRSENGNLVIRGDSFAIELITGTKAGADVLQLAQRGVIDSAAIVFGAVPSASVNVPAPRNRVALQRALNETAQPIPSTTHEEYRMTATTATRTELFGIDLRNARAISALTHNPVEVRSLNTFPQPGRPPVAVPVTPGQFGSRVVALLNASTFEKSGKVRIPVIRRVPIGQTGAVAYVPVGGRFPSIPVNLDDLRNDVYAVKVAAARIVPADLSLMADERSIAALEAGLVAEAAVAMDAAIVGGIPSEGYAGLAGLGAATTVAAFDFQALADAVGRVEDGGGDASAIFVSNDVRAALRGKLTLSEKDDLPPIIRVHGTPAGTAVVVDGAGVGIGIRAYPEVTTAEESEELFANDEAAIAVRARFTPPVLADASAVQVVKVA